ncbi:MAG: hypothetical protein HY079_08520 [Elusimicrobia bacterium]|nr:hypothetical protein [Elusimicrobiota bacterium]
MNRTSLVVLAAAVTAAGCGGRAQTKSLPPSTVPAAQVEKVKAASEASHESLDAAAGVPKEAKRVEEFTKKLDAPTGSAAPESDAPKSGEALERKGKVLGKDPDGCTWLEGEASVVVGDQDTRHQAHAAAMEHARAAAVQDFLGVDVNSKFMDFQQEGLRRDAHLTESILQTTRNGRIIKEAVLDEGYQDIPASAGVAVCRDCRYHLRMKACVLPKDSGSDKDFRVELEVSQNRFFNGDEAALTVSATRDCSVYMYDVYDLGEQDKTALVIPNEAVPAKAVKAGETWTYPSEQDKKNGVHLVAELAKPDQQISAETIRVICTKVPLKKAVYDPTDGGYLGVLSRLNRSRVEWAEDAAAYTIYKK